MPKERGNAALLVLVLVGLVGFMVFLIYSGVMQNPVTQFWPTAKPTPVPTRSIDYQNPFDSNSISSGYSNPFVSASDQNPFNNLK